MAFKKGISGNIKGREVGKANKVTKLQREFVQSLLDDQQDKIKKELASLKGKDYLAAVTGLLEFVVPKLNRTEVQASIRNEVKQVIIINGQEIEF